MVISNYSLCCRGFVLARFVFVGWALICKVLGHLGAAFLLSVLPEPVGGRLGRDLMGWATTKPSRNR